MAAFLIVFAGIHCPLVQFPKRPRTSVHTILFVAHLHPHFSTTRQTLKVSGKSVQTEEYPDSVACKPQA